MYINIEFLGVAYIVGKAVDYIVQGQESAEQKTKNKYVLTIHSYIYANYTSFILYILLSLTFYRYVFIIWILFVTHWIIDTRIPVKKIMYLKGIKYEEMDTKYGWLQIEVDQRLHELVILMLALVI